MKKKLLLFNICLFICMLCLNGCGRKERDRALKETEQYKADIEKLRSSIEELEIERDVFKDEAVEVSENLRKTKLELTSMLKVNSDLQNEVERLAEQFKKNNAMLQERQKEIVKYEPQPAVQNVEYEKQIDELVKQNIEYEKLVDEMQAEIERLEKQIKEMIELPAEQTENNEQSEMEIEDGNNV